MFKNLKYWNGLGTLNSFAILIQVTAACIWFYSMFSSGDWTKGLFAIGPVIFIIFHYIQIIDCVDNKKNITWALWPKYVMCFNELSYEDPITRVHDFIPAARIREIKEWLWEEKIPFEFRTINGRRKFFPVNAGQVLFFKNKDDMILTKLRWIGI